MTNAPDNQEITANSTEQNNTQTKLPPVKAPANNEFLHPSHHDNSRNNSNVDLKTGTSALPPEDVAALQEKILNELRSGNTHTAAKGEHTDAEYTSEQWKHDIERIIRRGAIEKYLAGSSSLLETRRLVRQFENDHQVGSVIAALVENEVNIDPTMAAVATDLSERIKTRFPRVKGIMLVGSAIHGGSGIRHITGSEAEPDLDWGVIYDDDKPLGIEGAHLIKEFVEEQIPDIVTKYGLPPEFSSCRVMNPANDSRLQVRNIPDNVKSMQDIPESFSNIHYFYPSFPPEINQRNRELYLKFMGQLYHEDPKKWRRHVEMLMDSWNTHHIIKDKHFHTAGREKDQELLARAVFNSSEVMEQPMRRTLESSKDIPQEKTTLLQSLFANFSKVIRREKNSS